MLAIIAKLKWFLKNSQLMHGTNFFVFFMWKKELPEKVIKQFFKNVDK